LVSAGAWMVSDMAGPGVRDEDKASAIAALRAALIAGGPIDAPLRACYYRHPMFCGALLSEAFRQRFAGPDSVREVARFIARLRINWPQAGPGFPYREAEAMIRGMLGDFERFEHVQPGDFSYPEIGIALLGRLFAEWQPGPAAVDSLFPRVEEVAAAAADLEPGLRDAEDQWFEAGMDRSPFAMPFSDTPPGRRA
jgi:hypothetical protein